MIRVLLVDDSAHTRRGLRMRLALEPDMDVVGEAQDARQALTMAAEMRPDVIVMDVCLPGIDGCEATRELRRAHPQTEVVMLSLYGDAARRAAAASAGASTFLEKNGDCDALLLAIRQTRNE